MARVSVPENCSVTGTFYLDSVLSAVVNHHQAKRPSAGVQGVKLLHENAPAHRSAALFGGISYSGLARPTLHP